MNVTFENVIQILEAADRIQAIDMKKYALNLIVHHFPKVFPIVLLKVSFYILKPFRMLLPKVARMPRIRSLSRELLLDVLEALADDMSDSKLQDLSSTSLNSET